MIAIVGSHTLWPTPALASAILTLMISHEDTFGIRCGRNGSPASAIEEMVWRIGTKTGKVVDTFSPVDSGLSGLTFRRDIRLVGHATSVYAFFSPDHYDEGGTSHVVAVALREGRPVTAYTLDADGDVIELGSDDGGQFFQEVGKVWDKHLIP